MLKTQTNADKDKFSVVSGCQRVPDTERRYIRLLFFHQKQTWELSSTARNDNRDDSLPEALRRLRPLELASVGLFLLWQAIEATAVGRATNYLRNIRYRLEHWRSDQYQDHK